MPRGNKTKKVVVKWYENVEIRTETTNQFFKRCRNLCQKRIGEGQKK